MKPFRAATLLCLLPAMLAAEAGVLIVGDNTEPDPSTLSLDEMRVEVRIEDQLARVRIQQIYRSHSRRVLEGHWKFALPEQASVSDFAVWDGITRIPGVILERRRAREIYETLRAQTIDPGLLQQGEGDAAEGARSSVFSARVTPIPGWGYKRIEVEYHETIAVEELRSRFSLPLRPDAYQAQRAARFGIEIELISQSRLRDFRVVGSSYPLQIDERTDQRLVAAWDGTGVVFDQDLTVEWELDDRDTDRIEVLTWRDAQRELRTPGRPVPTIAADAGYFTASALLAPQAQRLDASWQGAGPPPPASSGPPRTVVTLFDASLSMQWEKLDRGYQALETLLLRSRPDDRFNVVVFNSETKLFSERPSAAAPATIEQALTWVRSGRIRGGTDLGAALGAGLDQCAQAESDCSLVIISDGGATRGPVANRLVLASFERRLEALAAARHPRVLSFGVGDDANLSLLRLLAGSDGVFERVRSTEPIEFKLEAFLSKLGRRPLQNLQLAVSPAANIDMVYRLDGGQTFDGSRAAWAGRYAAPTPAATFRVSGVRDGAEIQIETTAGLPQSNLNHPHVPRVWARARVDALLAQIEREGEDDDTIEEIIAWSKRFKFVTPYTSFLAAPRSLLRPRVIRPGDPVLRVKTDESIVAVTALFPFGLTKKLRYLDGDDIWQTRFLAPKDTPDGRHEVRLLLRDRQGRVFREKKSFLVTSKPPEVRALFDRREFQRGERVELRVDASRTTRTLTARMWGVAPVSLRWSDAARANVGSFVIPAGMPPGEYPLRLTAEDFAHNIGVEEVRIAVVP